MQRRLMLTFFKAPDAVIDFALGKAPRTIVDGTRLDARTQLFMQLAEKSGQSFTPEIDVPTMRAGYVRMNRVFGAQTDPKHLDGVTVAMRDVSIARVDGTIAARLYTPSGTGGSGTAPLLVFYHGGGFVIGDVECYDHAARFIAAHAGLPVLSIDYRLGPESRAPIAVDDCETAFRFARAHAAELGVDPSRIAVGGDSAGGNLAAAVCHRLLAAGEVSPAYQFLIYPAVDGAGSYRSKTMFASGVPLTPSHMAWFMDRYLSSDADAATAEASPIDSPHLAAFPPAYVLAAGFDPLRDEGLAYVQRLQRAGVPATHDLRPSLSHAFVNLLGILPQARAALAGASLALRRALNA